MAGVSPRRRRFVRKHQGAAFVVGAFSVAGVPPAAGFFGKAALFRTGIAAEGSAMAVGLVALVFLGGALSFVSMLQLYQRRFWADDGGASSSSMRPRRVLVMALAGLVVGLGVWPEPLLAVSEQAAAVLPGRGSRAGSSSRWSCSIWFSFWRWPASTRGIWPSARWPGPRCYGEPAGSCSTDSRRRCPRSPGGPRRSFRSSR